MQIMMELEVTSGAMTTLLEEAARAAPKEACGILLGSEGRIEAICPTANVAADPRRHFEVDPQALIDAHRAARAGGPGVIGYYHSHPIGAAAPSATDRAMASGDGRVWAIVAQGEVRFWRDGAQGFEPLSYSVLEG